MSNNTQKTVKEANMPESMQQDAINIASQAIQKYKNEKETADYIKKEFDGKHDQNWRCIVIYGQHCRSFKSYVTQQPKFWIHLYLDRIAVLLYKLDS